jgi:hypothetical protein
LGAAQADAVRQLTAEQLRSNETLRKRLAEADDRLNQRITKEIGRKQR